MRRGTSLFLLIVLALVGIIVFLAAEHFPLLVRLALADEQTEIFHEMEAKAADALSKSPADTRAAVGYLQYAHHYYPSGTKQVTGSRLDRIVERSRSLAERRIIDMLRKVTGENRGENPDAWISAFDERSSAQHGLGR